jgi:hypothetical protein
MKPPVSNNPSGICRPTNTGSQSPRKKNRVMATSQCAPNAMVPLSSRDSAALKERPPFSSATPKRAFIRARQDAAEWDADSLITNRIRTDHDDHYIIDDHLPVLRPSRD